MENVTGEVFDWYLNISEKVVSNKGDSEYQISQLLDSEIAV